MAGPNLADPSRPKAVTGREPNVYPVSLRVRSSPPDEDRGRIARGRLRHPYVAVGPLRGQESSIRPIEGSRCSRQISPHEPHGFPLLRRARESDGGSVPRARDRDGGVIPRGVQLCSGRRLAGVPTAGSRGIADLAAFSRRYRHQSRRLRPSRSNVAHRTARCANFAADESFVPDTHSSASSYGSFDWVLRTSCRASDPA